MAEKRKLKKKAKLETPPPTTAELGPSKLEKAVADYMRSKVPVKRTRFLNHPVNYFNANKAIDVLLDSQWATGEDAIFTDRGSVVEFGNKLLVSKFFHRAKKIAVTDKDLSPKELKKKQEKEKLKKKEKEKKGEDTGTETPKKEDDEQNQEEKEEKQKKKRTKIKLDMHLDQVFVDGSDAYVWMYEPVPFWYYFAGGCVLFGAVAVCLFPLWPPSVRNGVYYLCVAAAGFLGVILGLAVVRLIVFLLIWMLSFGRHHLWILPNLTEDVGFFASFWPLYHYEYRGEAYDKKKKSKKKVKSDDDEETKKSDAEDAVDSQSAAETDAEKCNSTQEGTADENETDSENSNSQAFEIVDKEDIPNQEDDEEGQTTE